ncbi:MAG TPA: hypothetical protein VK695_11155 [Steroidobacteraceae bacterium]|nr:hypothetical protein [Steroidobacteraceae bacterium]
MSPNESACIRRQPIFRADTGFPQLKEKTVLSGGGDDDSVDLFLTRGLPVRVKVGDADEHVLPQQRSGKRCVKQVSGRLHDC